MAAYLEKESRQQCKSQPAGFVDSFLFSCELSSKISSFTFKVDEEDVCEHILTMRLISLGDGVKDECNVIEVVCLDRDRNELSIPVANLKLSVQPMVDLGNFELYPPVTFRLKSGSGPVHVSGNHLIGS
ncbi:nucleoplasmin-3 isoform X2 [Ambystoma mexicanum]|uniref:nucleoplasmin-3 isoform X2 n=1 Tax=Ambystoma mexicanum TaxID=8296 RepID=UPI0037E91027